MDLVIALGHIVTLIFHLSKAETKGTLAGCRALGVINEVALVASNLWYVMLAMDLVKAIRNPFRYDEEMLTLYVCKLTNATQTLPVIYIVLHTCAHTHTHTHTHSSQPSYKPLSHLIVWGFSALCGTVLVVLTIANRPGEAGT